MTINLDECFSTKLACDCEFRGECPLYDKLVNTSQIKYELHQSSARVAMICSGINEDEVRAYDKQHDEKRKILLAQANTSIAGSY